ncbi:hypothetical protein ACLOJK_024936 [Asimina triloba]
MSLPPFLIFNEAWISGSRPFITLATVPIICQHAHEPARCHGHHLARADCRVVDHASASTASAIACPLPDAPCRFIATICLLPAPSINGHDCTILVGSSLANMQPSVPDDKYVFGLF